MTREEAIKELEEDKALYMPEEWIESIDRDTPDGRLITALEMAIKALEQEPCESYTEIFPCKCEKCGAVFNAVKIIPPEKLPPEILHI